MRTSTKTRHIFGDTKNMSRDIAAAAATIYGVQHGYTAATIIATYCCCCTAVQSIWYLLAVVVRS